MGVDSGLPDFRGNEGFWRAYPPFKNLGLSFIDLANPAWFNDDPELAWGEMVRGGAWVFTSNVDGAFQRAGFDPDRIVECHGAIDFLQCTRACRLGIVPADHYEPNVDETTFRARPPLPRCGVCGALTRPNILMFGDYGWDDTRTSAQEKRLSSWLGSVGRGDKKLVVIECGAGSAVPTVRMTSERTVMRREAVLIRVNLREPQVPAGHIGIAEGALHALGEIDRRLGA
ncbi:MAG: NAD-dependent deacetylase [Polyangiaceae bacterium]|nr:NAD-dependent deacetylase [Polyangiaceae bacterium]